MKSENDIAIDKAVKGMQKRFFVQSSDRKPENS